ncbi:hypothetical protein LEC33_01075 [Salmonella enterica]|nr:hypothetical protein [Salmonella enterica]MDJ7334224.1 hypothetical protein [Salmonella enterica]
MAILENIRLLILDIEKSRSGKLKKEKIISLIDYVEQVNEHIKNTCSYLNHPYLNENKLVHALLEIQIQTRLMQIGKTKRFQELAVYLFNIRVLADKVINQPKTLYRITLNQ